MGNLSSVDRNEILNNLWCWTLSTQKWTLVARIEPLRFVFSCELIATLTHVAFDKLSLISVHLRAYESGKYFEIKILLFGILYFSFNVLTKFMNPLPLIIENGSTSSAIICTKDRVISPASVKFEDDLRSASDISDGITALYLVSEELDAVVRACPASFLQLDEFISRTSLWCVRKCDHRFVVFLQ